MTTNPEKQTTDIVAAVFTAAWVCLILGTLLIGCAY